MDGSCGPAAVFPTVAYPAGSLARCGKLRLNSLSHTFGREGAASPVAALNLPATQREHYTNRARRERLASRGSVSSTPRRQRIDFKPIVSLALLPKPTQQQVCCNKTSFQASVGAHSSTAQVNEPLAKSRARAARIRLCSHIQCIATSVPFRSPRRPTARGFTLMHVHDHAQCLLSCAAARAPTIPTARTHFPS